MASYREEFEDRGKKIQHANEIVIAFLPTTTLLSSVL